MSVELHDLEERLEEVRGEIRSAAKQSGRSEADVTLVAVTKTFPASLIRTAWAAGLRDFGENRVQEITAKGPELTDLTLNLHMIGHLQTNKVKAVLPHISHLHSVDRVHLAEEVAARLPDGRILPVFLQINTTSEASKSGATPEDAETLLDAVGALDGLSVRGLMTIGPLDGTEDDIRRSFVSLREIRDRLERASGLDLPWLSMGMSGDFAIAIEEGATHVRVGSRLFGERSHR